MQTALSSSCSSQFPVGAGDSKLGLFLNQPVYVILHLLCYCVRAWGGARRVCRLQLSTFSSCLSCMFPIGCCCHFDRPCPKPHNGYYGSIYTTVFSTSCAYAYTGWMYPGFGTQTGSRYRYHRVPVKKYQYSYSILRNGQWTSLVYRARHSPTRFRS